MSQVQSLLDAYTKLQLFPGMADRLKCGECSFHAADRTQFRDHLKVAHGAQKVVCPLCPIVQLLKTPSALKKHVSKAHKGVTCHPQIWDTSSMYYFACRPIKYRELTSPRPFLEEASVEARHRLVNFVEFVGTEEARKIMVEAEKDWARWATFRTPSSAKPTLPEKPSVAAIMPAKPSATQTMPEKPQYTERRDTKDLSVLDVQLGLIGTTSVAKLWSTLYGFSGLVRATFKPTNLRPILRVMEALRDIAEPGHSSEEGISIADEDMLAHVAQELGIPVEEISEVVLFREKPGEQEELLSKSSCSSPISSHSSPPLSPFRAATHDTPAPGVTSPINHSSPPLEVPCEAGLPFKPPTLLVSLPLPSPHPSEDHAPERTTASPRERSRSPLSRTGQSLPNAVAQPLAAPVPSDSIRPGEPTFSHPLLNIPMQQPPVFPPAPRVPGKLVQQPLAPHLKGLTALGKLPSVSASSSPSPPPPPPPPRKPKIPRISAAEENILKWGCWPILSPGCRDWDNTTPVQLPLPVTSIEWPPRNWKEMTGPQRLFALQAVSAMFSVGDQNPGCFPTAPPAALAEEYNFLALPGGGLTRCEDPFTKLTHNLRGALKSSQLTSPQGEVHTGMLDILATGRQRGPPARNDIIQRVNEAGVPLLPYVKGQGFESDIEAYDPAHPDILNPESWAHSWHVCPTSSITWSPSACYSTNSLSWETSCRPWLTLSHRLKMKIF